MNNGIACIEIFISGRLKEKLEEVNHNIILQQ